MRVTINDPAQPEGTEYEIPYLGLFRNGYSVELTDEQLANYEANTGKRLEEDIYIGDPDAELAGPVEEEIEDAPPQDAPVPEADLVNDTTDEEDQ